MRRLLFILAAGVLVALVASGRLPFGSAAEEESDMATAVQTDGNAGDAGLTPAPEGASVQVCLDPTGSTDPRFAASIKAALVEAVRSHLPAKPSETKNGVAAVPGVELTVRLVSTRPLKYGEPVVRFSVPAVSGLPARPDLTADGALDPGGPYTTWQGLEEQWNQQYDDARVEQSTAIKDLGAIDLSYAQRSGVRDCAAALASVAPAYTDATYVVASDLRDNTFTRSAPDFSGAPLLVIAPCPDGDAKTCAQVQNTFQSWMTQHGAGPSTLVRPEAAREALGDLISARP